MADDTSGDHSAKDNILKNSKITTVTLPSVENVQGFDGASNPDRVSQQGILNTAIVPKFLSPVQDFATPVTLNVTVPTGASAIFNYIINNGQQQLLLEDLAFQIYIGSVAPANMMPQSIGSANYPYYSFHPLYNPVTLQSTAHSDQSISTVQVRNNSGSSQNIFIEMYAKYIANQSNVSKS